MGNLFGPLGNLFGPGVSLTFTAAYASAYVAVFLFSPVGQGSRYKPEARLPTKRSRTSRTWVAFRQNWLDGVDITIRNRAVASDVIRTQAADFTGGDASVDASIQRLAGSICLSIAWHAKPQFRYSSLVLLLTIFFLSPSVFWFP